MRCSLYLRIAQTVEEHDNYFVQRRNAAGTLGFSCLQKVIVAYRQLAYAVLTDYVDEYVRIEESSNWVLKEICDVFGQKYLRPPNKDDTTRLLHIVERRGFLRMLDSIDYIHWK
jgi:hypothetical protein